MSSDNPMGIIKRGCNIMSNPEAPFKKVRGKRQSDREWKPHWPKPKPPVCRLIREGDTGKKCPKCQSSLHYRFKYFPFFFTTDRCIQKDCSNYHVTNLKLPDRVRLLRVGDETKVMDWDEDGKQWDHKYTLSGDFDIELAPDFDCNYPDCMIDKINKSKVFNKEKGRYEDDED